MMASLNRETSKTLSLDSFASGSSGTTSMSYYLEIVGRLGRLSGRCNTHLSQLLCRPTVSDPEFPVSFYVLHDWSPIYTNCCKHTVKTGWLPPLAAHHELEISAINVKLCLPSTNKKVLTTAKKTLPCGT